MSKAKYALLEEYFDEIVHQAVEECVLCGECLRHCLTYPLSPLKDKDPEDIMKKIIDFLKNGVYSDDVYLRAFSCAACENCTDSCPQGINLQLIHEAVKIKLFRQEGKQPEALNFGIPGQKMDINAILSGIQMKPSEERWLKRVPSSPKITENVVFLGCAPLALPDKIFTFLDILERMGIDFVPLAGGELCCGLIYFPAGGKVKESEEKGRELIASIKAFSPKRVILICTGCYRQFTEFFPNFSEPDFDVQYYTQFLSDNLEKLNFIKPLEETITFHDSCFLARGSKDTETSRKILEAIPGLKLVEMEHSEAPRPQDGASKAKPSETAPKPPGFPSSVACYCGGRAPRGLRRGSHRHHVGSKPEAKTDHPRAPARGILAKASNDWTHYHRKNVICLFS